MSASFAITWLGANNFNIMWNTLQAVQWGIWLLNSLKCHLDFFFFTSIQVSELDSVVIKRKRTENSLIIVNISKKTLTLKQTALLCLHRQQEQKQRLCEGYKGGGYNCGYQLFAALYCSTFSSDNKCYLFLGFLFWATYKK